MTGVPLRMRTSVNCDVIVAPWHFGQSKLIGARTPKTPLLRPDAPKAPASAPLAPLSILVSNLFNNLGNLPFAHS